VQGTPRPAPTDPAAALSGAYTGNVYDAAGQSTRCPGCGELVIERDWYRLGAYRLTGRGRCASCDARIPGVFDGPPGTWGPRRLPVRLAPPAACDLPRDWGRGMLA
jgi:pyruvate formate lyase activating enzyme